MINQGVSLENVGLLKIKLSKEKPQHDTPIGLIHPYWARKPLNIVDTIIQHLSKPGDLILDPFAGSGTIPFSAVSNNRLAIGSDLNPLSIFISRNIIGLGKIKDSDLVFVKDFFKKAGDIYSKWFFYNGEMIERIRYQVMGEYTNGNFRLTPTEIVTKRETKNAWKGRNVYDNFELPELTAPKRLLSSPINFKKIELPENSRIAIPKGANLAHFFDEKNICVINYLYELISSSSTNENVKNAMLFILSSSMPLLRLSDKKASSQWPYWRPKTVVTSRNPFFVISKRIDAFEQGVEWARDKASNAENISLKKLYQSSKVGSYSINQSPAQNIRDLGIKNSSIDLILTDPPYADQAPYLEYSELWNSLLFQKKGSSFYSSEIVKTDAPLRKRDDSQYIFRLSEAFKECCEVLKPNGYLAFFYQDRNLLHWSEIAKTLNSHGLVIIDVLALPKQRRSLKTVTSPGRTFDGDLLVIARKQKLSSRTNAKNKIISTKTSKTFFEKYAEIIRHGLVSGKIDSIAESETDIFSLIK